MPLDSSWFMPAQYCSVIGAKWIEREDRLPEDPPEDFDPEFPAAPYDDEADAHKCERDREAS